MIHLEVPPLKRDELRDVDDDIVLNDITFFFFFFFSALIIIFNDDIQRERNAIDRQSAIDRTHTADDG